eukprot:2936940-Lingulodinium_polyedra.AAC.1
MWDTKAAKERESAEEHSPEPKRRKATTATHELLRACPGLTRLANTPQTPSGPASSSVGPVAESDEESGSSIEREGEKDVEAFFAGLELERA